MEITLLDKLIKQLSKLPGLGPRSARRIALHLLKGNRSSMIDLSDMLRSVAESVKSCTVCGNLDTTDVCAICSSPNREKDLVCVVEDVSDLWAMERGNIFRGTYHVLGGTLSAIDGRTPDKLNFDNLIKRVSNNNVREVIIATNSTLEGQTTGFYVADIIKPYNVKATKLAHGIPIGAELDYLDDGTLLHALKMRQDY